MNRGVRPLVLGNWKMNLDFVEAVHLTQQLTVLLKNKPAEHTDVVVVPPFVDLRSVTSVIASEKIDLGVGAQHVNPHDNGAHTGEISVAMLQRLGVGWVIVGHSERRSMYAMDDETVARTLNAVVRAGLRAVLCVGENAARREAGEHESFVDAQLRSALAGLDERYHDQVSVAYEPIWAIGTGATASTSQVEEMTGAIREQLEKLSLRAPRILYGGSVNDENAENIMRATTADGFLVGGASLKAESFGAIIRACNDCYAGNR